MTSPPRERPHENVKRKKSMKAIPVRFPQRNIERKKLNCKPQSPKTKKLQGLVSEADDA